jgi:hypothetical protein
MWVGYMNYMKGVHLMITNGLLLLLLTSSVRRVTAGKFDKCLHFWSIFLDRKLIRGLIVRYVSLNITENIIIIRKPNIFTKTRTQDSFRVCDLSSCNLLAETNNSVLCAVLLSCLASEIQKPSSPGLEPRTVFIGVVAFVPVISSSKQITSVSVTFFYRA